MVKLVEELLSMFLPSLVCDIVKSADTTAWYYLCINRSKAGVVWLLCGYINEREYKMTRLRT